MCKPSPSVHSLSTTKTSAVPPRGHTWELGTLQSQAKLQGISEQQWAPEMWCAGPPCSGHALTPVNHCPSYGQIDPLPCGKVS